MPDLIVTRLDGSDVTIEAKSGVSVMQTIRDAGIDDLLALCGGCCSCATCHVVVDPAQFGLTGTPSPDEVDLLEGSSHQVPTSRLSCQILMTDALAGLHVTIAPEG